MTAPALPSVWLVEDNASYRRAVMRALEQQPDIAGVRGFGCCEEALQAIATAEPPDVVLMDVGLPGMSGLEGIAKVKARLPATAVLVLTVFEEEDKILQAICAGASGYLLKKARLQEVVAAIREVHAGGSPMTPRIARRVLGMFAQLAPKPAHYNLSPRESEILGLLVRGLPKKQIAAELEVSLHTVDMHMRHVYTKLHVNSGTAAVAKALQERLV